MLLLWQVTHESLRWQLAMSAVHITRGEARKLGNALLDEEDLLQEGTIGLLRFPDPMSRLHALTKADGAGLGLCVAGLALIARDLGAAVLMVLIWLGVMLSGATAAHLVARRALERRDSADGG